VSADPIFSVGDFVVTNSLFASWVAVLIIIVLCLLIRKSIRKVPGKLQGFFELVVEKFLEMFDALTGSRETSVKFFPFVFTFFIFILINNWMGLLPGVGSIGQIVESHGQKMFIPYIRGGNADINTTLALALIGVTASHIVGVVYIGFWRYINKFINFEALADIPKKMWKEPSVLLVNPIKVFTGLIEIVSEISKVVSLSFRLFGNIFAGEVLLAMVLGLLAFGLPLPFMFLEVLVGLVQAFIFALLVLSYLVMMTSLEAH
jgi:F-type H+-transporting ATPase subunit a